ncbi:MAG: hypothetical protein EPO55_02740 [Reyranella sp.]|uniref:hypothetical protein n=1 Tax=Reyranella sp. TaxID=1929291 RepID=UPI0012034A90|nr:hypothetical protein [Reyranella sp.]TAJ42170.1 MAG: hypothetical protein EPO55_02740 [Reyranella sp.]
MRLFSVVRLKWGSLESAVLHRRVLAMEQLASLNSALLRRRILAMGRIESAYYAGLAFLRRHRTAMMWAAAILAVLASCFTLPWFRPRLVQYFEQISADQSDKLSIFRALVGTIGGALVGATAIAFSVVMISVQINFARMPYGLFRRLSSDFILLGYFGGTFILAFLVAATALIPGDRIAEGVLVAGWGSALSFLLFLLAYRRALELINPVFQVGLIVSHATKTLRWWSRRATRVKALIVNETSNGKPASHDVSRAGFFLANPNWSIEARRSIDHAIAFSRTHGVLGDHEVSRVALVGVVQINAAYIDAKGKTFFTLLPFGGSPLVTDEFVNSTLERLRQHLRDAISRKDETGVELAFQTLSSLVVIYSRIDYGDRQSGGKYHAKLVAGYLCEGVTSTLPHDMPDVVMNGVRQMGIAATTLLANGDPNDFLAVVEKLTPLGAVGVAHEKLRPVTMTVMEQLKGILCGLLVSKFHDIGYAAKRINEGIELLVTIFIDGVPDKALSDTHGSNLGPIYSLRAEGTFPYWLMKVGNELLTTKADDLAARRIADHLEDWSEELFQRHKPVFVLAIEKRSNFTGDLISWIGHVCRTLMAVSTSDSCRPHTAESLKKNARNLVSVLSWVPDDNASLDFVENYRLDEELFEIAEAAIHRSCAEVFDAAERVLMELTFGRGHQNRWSGAEDAICAFATLALMNVDGAGEMGLKGALTKRLSKTPLFAEGDRDSVASAVRTRAENFAYDDYVSSRIDVAMRRVDRARLERLLLEIADIISPSTLPAPK